VHGSERGGARRGVVRTVATWCA